MSDTRSGKEILTDKRILIFQQRGWSLRIGHYVARSLQSHGATLAALTFKPSTDAFTRSQTEVDYALIEHHDTVMNDPKARVGAGGATLEKICEDLGVNSLWPFAQSLRNHVRSYEEAFYYSYRQNVPDEIITLYFQAAYDLCESILDEFKPDLVIAPNFVALPHIFMRHLTWRREVPMFGVTDTKIRGVQCFTHSYFDDAGPFIDRISQLQSGETSPNRERAQDYLESNRIKLSRPDQMDLRQTRQSTYRDIRMMISHIRHSLRNPDYIPLFGHTVDAPSIRMILRDFIKKRQYAKAARKRSYADLRDVGRFAFFPLQVQPEATCDVIAPLYNNQIELLRQVAMSLPGDLTLVVKEHPTMVELRKPSYLEKIARTPNVKLVDYRVPAEQIIRQAEMIIASSGTVISEAAILGVPAIQLGALGTTRRLPNVIHHPDVSTLGEAIDRAQSMSTDSKDYKTQLENYVSAAYDAGFELEYAGLWDGGNEATRDAVVEKFILEAARCLK